MSWKDTYKVWQERTDLEPDLKQELAAMSDDKEIEDAFYGPLSFGTAGMRGLMGPGINRMNVYTVRLATEGLATLISKAADMSELDQDTKNPLVKFTIPQELKKGGEEGLSSFQCPAHFYGI